MLVGSDVGDVLFWSASPSVAMSCYVQAHGSSEWRVRRSHLLVLERGLGGGGAVDRMPWIGRQAIRRTELRLARSQPLAMWRCSWWFEWQRGGEGGEGAMKRERERERPRCMHPRDMGVHRLPASVLGG